MICTSANIIPVNILRRMRWGGHVARMGDMMGCIGVLVEKPEGNENT